MATLEQEAAPVVRNRIKEVLQERGVTTYRFAMDTGVSVPAAVKMLKPSVYPRHETVATICKTYNLKPWDFLVFDDVELSASDNKEID